MSDFGMFESDEAAADEPRRQARTAARKLDAAIDTVRVNFGRFLLGATGIDEFEDRWHLSKNDIRASVEPLVFPNTGTMRRIQNAMKSDWKLAHPYKLAIDHDDAGFGSMPEGDSHRNQDLDETYSPSSGNLVPSPDFEGYKNSVDQGGPEKVEANDFTPGGDSGSDRQARRRQAKNDDDYDGEWCEGNCSKSEGCPRCDGPEEDTYRDEDTGRVYKKESRRIDVEAAKLVADIYTDFAQSNGLRVASMRSLDAYASTGIAEADYRILANLIRIAEEEEAEKAAEDDEDSDSEAPEASESDDSDSDDDEGDDYDFGGEDHDDADHHETATDSDDDGDHDDDDHHDDEDDEYDFGGGDDDSEGGEGGGEQYTVPDQAPDLDPQLLNEIPHDDPQGAAPVPPEVIDSLLGLPEGTIEQLLMEEVEQGQGGSDGYGAPEQGAPQGGGDDFLGEGGDDAEQEPSRMAARRRFARLHQAKDCNCWDGYCRVPGTKPCAEGSCEKCDTHRKESRRRQANTNPLDVECPDCGADQGEPCLVPADQLDGGPHHGQGFHENRSDPEWHQEYFSRFRLNRNDGSRQYNSSRRQARQFWAAPDESEDELTERQKREQKDSLDTQHESWMKSKAARRFWAADDEQPAEGGGGEQQAAPAQDPAAAMGGGDPAAMGGQPMMPPPGSGAVAPPAPPQQLEDQPAEDALLDTANQAIMQMIDRETQEYQQIIDPLSQALQAIQFAQQVEQSEHPMDVTPPQGTVDVSPAAAPGGAQSMQQQASRRIARETREVTFPSGARGREWDCHNCGAPVSTSGGRDTSCRECDAQYNGFGQRLRDNWRDNSSNYDEDMGDMEGYENSYGGLYSQRDARLVRKKKVALRNAATVIAQRYRLSATGERMLLEAMGRGNYEHVREALQAVPREYREAPATHIGHLFAADNPRFSRDQWMRSVMAATAKDRYETKSYTGPRDKRRDEHGDDDLNFDDFGDEMGEAFGMGGSSKFPNRRSSRGRLPFDRPRTAGETLVPTATMDIYEHQSSGVPEVTDNLTSNDLPKMKGAEPNRKAYLTPRQADVMKSLQTWLKKQKSRGLADYGDTAAEGFLNTRKKPLGERATEMVHTTVGAPAHPPAEEAPAKVRVPKAVNPVTKKGTRKLAADSFYLRHKETGRHGEGYRLFPGPNGWDDRDALGIQVKWDEDPMTWGPKDNPDTEDAQYRTERNPTAGYTHYDRKIYPLSDFHVLDSLTKSDPDETQDPFDPRLIGAGRKQASFFTRRVPGWKWDDHLSGYISKEARNFTCSCGESVGSPSYKTCKCGKIWNVYAIGDTHHLASDTADMYIAREIEVRDNVIMANRKLAGAHPDDFYPEVPGYTDPGARRLQQILRDNRGNRPVNAIEGIPADADYYLEHGDPHAAWVLQKEKQHGKPLSQFTQDDWAIAGDPPPRKTSRRLAGWETSEYDPDDDPDSFTYQHPDLPLGYCKDCDGELGDRGISGPVHDVHGDMFCEYCADDRKHQNIEDEMNIYKGWNPDDSPGSDDPRIKGASRRAQATFKQYLAEIERLADWTKYDGPDPSRDPKAKPPSTKIPKQPKDWTKRTFTGPDKGKWTSESDTFTPKKK